MRNRKFSRNALTLMAVIQLTLCGFMLMGRLTHRMPELTFELWLSLAIGCLLSVFVIFYVWSSPNEARESSPVSETSPLPASTQTPSPVNFAEMAHDLRSPLNAIIGFASLMEEQVKGPLPEVYKAYPGMIREGGENLLDMIEGVLKNAREGGAPTSTEFTQISLNSSAEAARTRFELRCDQQSVKLVLLSQGPEVFALANSSILARIWDNLISNALKYSEPGGKIFLMVQERSDGAYFGVRDLGVGMSQADLQRIGARFVQGQNVGNREGSGLGLSIVTQLTELHSGRLTVRSAPGEGTEVEICLPKWEALNG